MEAARKRKLKSAKAQAQQALKEAVRDVLRARKKATGLAEAELAPIEDVRTGKRTDYVEPDGVLATTLVP